MPFASSITEWLMTALLIVVGLAFYAGLGWVILKLYRWYRRQAEAAIERAYANLHPHWPAVDGDVTLLFHTYFGFFVWFSQIEHRVALPPDQARVLLRRLHQFNLNWGLLCPFVVAVPLLSLVHYWEQTRSIRNQVARQTAKPASKPPFDEIFP